MYMYMYMYYYMYMYMYMYKPTWNIENRSWSLTTIIQMLLDLGKILFFENVRSSKGK